MSGAFSQLRSLLARLPARDATAAQAPEPAALEPHPCVGFRASYSERTCVLTVTVLAARHLPAAVGGVPAAGYIVRVKLFPGKEKFDTASRPESWPAFNERFQFPLAAGGLTSDKFLTFTVLGVDQAGRNKPLGSATWPLDRAAFTAVGVASDTVQTADVWRRVQTLSAGLQDKRVKDQVELSIYHVPGGVGEDDVVKLRILRLRWSLDKTREYQHKQADLYVKLAVVNKYGQLLRAIKTLCFSPSISVTWPADDKRAVLEAVLPPLGPRNQGCHFIITLCAKLPRGKKVHLGRAVIKQVVEADDSESAHWTQAMRAPGSSEATWHDLLPVEQ